MHVNDKLKPCPFCGGEDVKEYDSDWGIVVRCSECPAIMTESPYLGVLNPVEAWNTRAERTCTFSVYQTGDEHFPTCSACRYEAAREECEDYVGVVYYEKRFCPNCGAKVV